MAFFYEHKTRVIIVGAVLSVLLLIGGLFIWQKQNEKKSWASLPLDSSSQIEQTKESKTKVKTITVDIKGEVAKPGVYELPMDSRMQKLVQVAGGFTEGALQKEINLAQKLQDQQMVYVPNQKESTSVSIGNDFSVNKKATSNSEMVNINTADLTKLQTLSGIGEKKAEAIIAYREENGNFKSIEELKEVSGIGEKTVEKLRASITI